MHAKWRACARPTGPLAFHPAIRRAHWDTLTRPRLREPRAQFRYARYGSRDWDRCAAASN